MEISKIIDSMEQTIIASLCFLNEKIPTLKEDFEIKSNREKIQKEVKIMIDLLTTVDLSITFLENLEAKRLR